MLPVLRQPEAEGGEPAGSIVNAYTLPGKPPDARSRELRSGEDWYECGCGKRVTRRDIASFDPVVCFECRESEIEEARR